MADERTLSFRERMKAIDRERMAVDASGLWAPPGWDRWPAGQMLRARRRFSGLDQRELARRAGLDQSDVSRIERGLDSRSSTLGRLARALECDLVLRLRPADPSKPPVFRSRRLGPRRHRVARSGPESL